MAIHGEVYTTIRAEAVNAGISTMAISGSSPVSGDESVTVVIRWVYDPDGGSSGISGVSWFCEEEYGPIWDYTDSGLFNEYLNTLSTDQVRDIIEEYMNTWDATRKSGFLTEHYTNLPGCIEFVPVSS